MGDVSLGYGPAKINISLPSWTNIKRWLRGRELHQQVHILLQSASSRDMGVSPGTIRKWLMTLRDQRYIHKEGNGRCLQLEVNLWKTPGEAHKRDTQSVQAGPPRVAQMGHTPEALNSENRLDLSHEFEDRAGPNDRSIKRDIS